MLLFSHNSGKRQQLLDGVSELSHTDCLLSHRKFRAFVSLEIFAVLDIWSYSLQKVFLLQVICTLTFNYVACRWNELCTVGRYHRNYTTGLHQRLCLIYHDCLRQVSQRPTLCVVIFNNKHISTELEPKAGNLC